MILKISFSYHLQNPVCVLHLQHLLIHTCLIASVWWPHVAGGYHVGSCFPKPSSSPRAVLALANLPVVLRRWVWLQRHTVMQGHQRSTVGNAPRSPGLLYQEWQPQDCHPLEKAPSGVCGCSEKWDGVFCPPPLSVQQMPRAQGRDLLTKGHHE